MCHAVCPHAETDIFLVMWSVIQGAYKDHIMWVGVGLTWLEGGGDSLKEVLFQWAPKDFSR